MVPAIGPSDKAINCQLGSLAAFQKIPRPWEYAKQWPDTAHVHGAPERPSWGLNYTLTESHVNNHKLRSTFYSFLHKKSFYPHPWHKMLSFFSVILFYTFLSTYSMIFNMFGIFKIKMTFSFIYEEKIKINCFCHAQIKKNLEEIVVKC